MRRYRPSRGKPFEKYERWEDEIPSIDNDDELTHFYKPPKYKDYDER